ncbi:UbiA family prenyltransferase [Azohydromonas australica]|uniref:UbiA family prenyltransferase n=1 Tax=Azohydromonas australica TaxID=364039 RepID=UPI0004136E6B|nr:UbiA family prenyltransferase [Azohydromonas australica]
MGQVVLLANAPVPLVVDLDDTLVRSGLQAECLLVQAKTHPAMVPTLLPALLGGHAPWRQAFEPDTMPDVKTLPYHGPLLEYLQVQQHLGRRIVLATAAPEEVAQAVARHLHLCEVVLAAKGTDGGRSGHHLRALLVARFGERGYDYAGHRRTDLPVWSSARRAVVVGVDAALAADVQRLTTIEQAFTTSRPSLHTWLGAARWKHWLKNLLVFLPWLADERLRGTHELLAACAAFVGFCLTASSVYLINDLIDLPGDRRHPHKRQRALACGRLSIAQAVWLVVALWTAAAVVASRLPGGVGLTLAGYVALMLVYTLRLKDHRVVDAMALGGGYALRVVAGAVALPLDAPMLLYGWSAFTFGGLALLKRRAELAVSIERLGDKGHARTYRPSDARMLEGMGQACAAVGALWLALQPLVDPPRAGAARWALWSLCLLLWTWTQHMWRMARQARIRTDPVDFALHDASSRIVVVLMLLLLWIVA